MMREFEAIDPVDLHAERMDEGRWPYNLNSSYIYSRRGTRKANLLDIRSFVTENQIKFVTGIKPMSEFDAYVEQIRTMGMGEIVKCVKLHFNS